eukprot:jgi/Botrbrau1/10942/Bobra.0025s0115.1
MSIDFKSQAQIHGRGNLSGERTNIEVSSFFKLSLRNRVGVQESGSYPKVGGEFWETQRSVPGAQKSEMRVPSSVTPPVWKYRGCQVDYGNDHDPERVDMGRRDFV